MQFKKTVFRLTLLLLPYQLIAQSANLPQGSKHLQLLDRLEILMQDNQQLNFSAIKPFSRQTAVRVAELADSTDQQPADSSSYHLSIIDRYNLQSLLMNNSEWVTGDQNRFQSKKPLWNTFYTSKADFLQVKEKDFFLSVNPVIQQQQSLERGNGQRVFLNAKGITARGVIANRVGFDFYLTDNQERTPLFVQALEDRTHAVPGAGFYKSFKKTAYDYFDARGSVYFSAARYFHFQFGYDRNFIGNGYRSMILSDYASSYLFFKINTKIWKLDYTNLFMELTPQFNSNPGNVLLPKKYAAMHRLGINVGRWMNIGLFESIIFGRANRFEFSYLNPVIFLRSAEQQNGSPDNALVGVDVKANVAHKVQLYGQLMLDEFLLREIRSGRGWWGNKYALQAGLKYINALGINNLDIQGEINVARPFTYSRDSISNYTHYNQPLAHPLGANFIEGIGIIRYQPAPRWNAVAKIILFNQGLDTAGRNFGGNILLNNITRFAEYGYGLPSGVSGKGVNASLLLSYEIRENVFIEGSLMRRSLQASGISSLPVNSTLLTAGIRMNMFRREYDY